MCHWSIIESMISLIKNNKQCAAETAGRKHVHDCSRGLMGLIVCVKVLSPPPNEDMNI